MAIAERQNPILSGCYSRSYRLAKCGGGERVSDRVVVLGPLRSVRSHDLRDDVRARPDCEWATATNCKSEPTARLGPHCCPWAPITDLVAGRWPTEDNPATGCLCDHVGVSNHRPVSEPLFRLHITAEPSVLVSRRASMRGRIMETGMRASSQTLVLLHDCGTGFVEAHGGFRTHSSC